MYIGTCTDIIADGKVMFLIHENICMYIDTSLYQGQHYLTSTCNKQ